MHRIDGPTRTAALPAPNAAGTGASSPGFFAHGDLVGGVPATVVSPDWANAVQEEILAPIEYAGLTPDKNNPHQLLAAIRYIATGGSGEEASGSLGVIGYRVHLDGFIEQWGYVTGPFTSEQSVAVDFPIDFPTECFGISGTVINATASATGDTHVQEVSVSATGATVFLQSQNSGFSDAAGGFRWRATGH